MKWIKLGLIYKPQRKLYWAQSHASVPISDHIKGELFRVYFTSRDVKNRSHVGWFEFNLSDPTNILQESEFPILAPGKVGTFDADGVMASTLVHCGEERRIYYIGWNRAIGVPFRNSIGLAIQRNPYDPFERYSDGPVLDRGISDPYFLASHDVMREGKSWHIWYLSGLDWIINDPPSSSYNLRYATSSDGINWQRHGTVAIDFEHPGEIAIARPTVVNDEDLWRMWYCYRGTNFDYRIGYAESTNAVRWIRCDTKAGISVSTEGWDSEMVCYPHVFDHNGKRYMLYNGNSYGGSGIGLAILE